MDFTPWLLAPSSGGFRMPPIQQQETSGGGLITAMVVSIVFAVGFLIWAFMSSADLTKAQQALDTQKSKYDKVIGAGALGDVPTLTEQFSADPAKPRSGNLIDAATEQRKELVKTISGVTEGSEKKAMDDVTATIAAIKAAPQLKDVAIPEGAGLTAVTKATPAKAIGDADALARAKADLVAANQAQQAAITSQQAENAKRDQAGQETQAGMDQAVAEPKGANDDQPKP